MSSKFVKNADAVADDRNWIGLIKNEEKCAEVWEKDWGFLAGGADKIKKEEATKIFTVDDRIKRLNEELEKLEGIPVWGKTSTDYGKNPNVELEQVTKYNITINKELMPQPRHLPKTWKKDKKYKPAPDPFPELSGKLPPRGGTKRAAPADG